jgi:hypothetical protein
MRTIYQAVALRGWWRDHCDPGWNLASMKGRWVRARETLLRDCLRTSIAESYERDPRRLLSNNQLDMQQQEP